MNQYHIRIDGEQSTDSYTYQELVDMGLFELDADSLNGIEVKKTTKPNFTPLKSYCFPERQSNESSYYVDEYGQIHRRNSSQSNDHNGAYVDEFGQIVRPNSPSRSSSSSSSSTSTSSSSTSSSGSNYSSGSDGWTTFWRIIGTIIVVAIAAPIAVAIADSGGGKFLVAIPIMIGYWILKAIWDWDD